MTAPLQRQNIRLAQISDEQRGGALWRTGRLATPEHRCRCGEASSERFDLEAGRATQSPHNASRRTTSAIVAVCISAGEPVLEAIDMRLQPVDPDIDASAMSALSFCHSVFLRVACSRRESPARRANRRFRRHSMRYAVCSLGHEPNESGAVGRGVCRWIGAWWL